MVKKKTAKEELEQETVIDLDEATPVPDESSAQEMDAIRQKLRAEQEQRRQRCGSRIQAILDEEGCRIEPIFTITTQGIMPRVDIVPTR